MSGGLLTLQDDDSRGKVSKLDVGLGFLSRGVNGGTPVEPPKRAQVVIVGAGLAGLAAAQRLHEHELKDVIILEALDRVGGRVHTIKHSDYLLELGAQWLHGADDNPLHQWLTSMSMLDDFEDSSLGFDGSFCTSDSSDQISPNLVEKVLKVLNGCKDSLFKDKLTLAGNNESASQVFRRHLEQRMREDPDLTDNQQLVYSILEWFLRYETIENCCDSMDDVSIQSYTDWTDLGDGTLLNFKDGYQSLLAWFCEHFPRNQWLHLNKHVLNVELLSSNVGLSSRALINGNARCWLDSLGQAHGSPVLVRYKDSDPSSGRRSANQESPGDSHYQQFKTIECNHVIVTASLGFLKGHLESFFTPQLSSGRQKLIESIGFGTVNKIVLQFKQPFWPNKSGGIKLVWRDEDFESDQSDSSLPNWARDILAFDVVRRQPNLLIGWIGGQGAKAMESETDEFVGEVCLRILEKFLPRSHQRPIELVACLCSRWHSNPFVRGSYSFQSMKSLGLELSELHEPIYENQIPTLTSAASANQLKNESPIDGNNNQSDSGSGGRRIPRVMFAGEATAGKLYSTTHGAVMSGWREADRLCNSLMINVHADH